jgi:hypothetical protein
MSGLAGTVFILQSPWCIRVENVFTQTIISLEDFWKSSRNHFWFYHRRHYSRFMVFYEIAISWASKNISNTHDKFSSTYLLSKITFFDPAWLMIRTVEISIGRQTALMISFDHNIWKYDLKTKNFHFKCNIKCTIISNKHAIWNANRNAKLCYFCIFFWVIESQKHGNILIDKNVKVIIRHLGYTLKTWMIVINFLMNMHSSYPYSLLAQGTHSPCQQS